MDDNQLRILAQKLNEATPPSSAFIEEDWSKLRVQLDQHDYARKLWSPYRWWLTGLAVLLLLSNLYWLLLWRNGYSRLQTQLNQAYARIDLLDTIFSTTTLYKYDTIYQYRVIIKSDILEPARSIYTDTTRASGALSMAEEEPILCERAVTTALTHAERLSTSKSEVYDTTDSDYYGPMEEAPLVPSIELPSSLKSQYAAIYQPQYPTPEHIAAPSVDESWHEKRNIASLIPLPRGFQIGALAGIQEPQAKFLAAKSGSCMGIGGQLDFSRSLAITLRGRKSHIQFKGYGYDASLGIPPLNPPSDEYTFKYFETTDGGIPLWSLSGGVRLYLLNKGNNPLRPYLGAEYTTMWRGAHTVEMEYIHTSSGYKTGDNILMPAQKSPLQYSSIHLGLSYRLEDRLQLQGGIAYEQFLKSGQIGIPRFRTLQVGLLYRLQAAQK